MDRALLVGINKYPDAPLYGCVNDVTDMAELLVGSFGFKRQNIRILTDERATRHAIEDRLAWLTAGLKAGDRGLFMNSTHGAQVATRALSGEIDSLDEVVCPVDFDWTDEHMLRDKDFARIFREVPAGVEFIWIADSCHSGDLLRGAMAPGGSRAKSFPETPDMRWRRTAAYELVLRTSERGLQATTLAATAAQLNIALISGCKSSQTSADASFEGRANGALSRCLMDELAGLPCANLTKLVARVTSRLKKRGFTQTPQIAGSSAIRSKPFLSVLKGK